jgi:hypothetical protein
MVRLYNSFLYKKKYCSRYVLSIIPTLRKLLTDSLWNELLKLLNNCNAVKLCNYIYIYLRYMYTLIIGIYWILLTLCLLSGWNSPPFVTVSFRKFYSFPRLLASGRLDSPSIFIPGFVNTKRKTTTSYRQCAVTDPNEKKSKSTIKLLVFCICWRAKLGDQ